MNRSWIESLSIIRSRYGTSSFLDISAISGSTFLVIPLSGMRRIAVVSFVAREAERVASM
jgi:hypothetical protein